MKKFITGLLVLAIVGFAAFWLITMPATIPASALTADYKPDLKNGETMFTIGGCAACHMTPGQKDRHSLGGGMALATASFGTFYAPNISPDSTNGIGGWTEQQFLSAVMRGTGAHGEHLYPALPYTSYAKMKVEDVRDLYAFLKTVPAVNTPNKPHEIKFPFNIRLALGGWKLLYLDTTPFTPDPAKSATWNRGAYLVEGPGHCAECHSPRDPLGGIIPDRRFSGGIDAEGKGWVPNITPHADGIKSWSKDDIASFLSSGLTPDADSVGGTMAEVIQNTSRLTDADRAAMGEYLASLPPRPGKAPKKSGS
jgi:mono/diheme cytochrome c family protein